MPEEKLVDPEDTVCNIFSFEKSMHCTFKSINVFIVMDNRHLGGVYVQKWEVLVDVFQI